MNPSYKTEDAPLKVVRQFNAPKKLVFNAFSTEAALAEWWGPVECQNTVLKPDFKKGGHFHFKMEMNGYTNYGRFTFGEIQPYDLLEFKNAFTNEKGEIVKAPFDVKLPLEIFYRFLFSENEEITTMTMYGWPVNPSQEEADGFSSIDEDMQRGFGATFNKLSVYLDGLTVVQ